MLRVIAIEGNVGAGKSTVLAALEKAGVHVVREPVHQWTEHICGAYGDDRAWKLPMQMISLTTREESLHRAARAARDRGVATIVVERSNASADVFARATLSEVEYTAFAVAKERYDDIAARRDVRVSETVYLRVDPVECARRINVRNRAGEHGVDAAFLRELHDAHETAFAASSTTIDAGSEEKVVADVMAVVGKHVA